MLCELQRLYNLENESIACNLRRGKTQSVCVGQIDICYMSILIVDDDSGIRKVLELRLIAEGFDVVVAINAKDAFGCLGMGQEACVDQSIDLILMDILMPDVRGIEACRQIKDNTALMDIPIILMTASSDTQHLEEAFNAGAIDYISKPFKKVELLARIRSALRLKSEIDKRKIHEQELTETTRKLQEANQQLTKLSSVDGLTEVYNRRYFDEVLDREFQRAIRNSTSLSLIMIDVDGFKAFNDTYGHQLGDRCLKRISLALKSAINRSHDFVARYGGEEFAVMLPETSQEGVDRMAATLLDKVRGLEIEHLNSPVGDRVTISLGTVSMLPNQSNTSADLIARADQALYQSKANGRNRSTSNSEFSPERHSPD